MTVTMKGIGDTTSRKSRPRPTKAEAITALRAGKFVVLNYNRVNYPTPLAIFDTESETEIFLKSIPLARSGREVITHKDRQSRVFIYGIERDN